MFDGVHLCNKQYVRTSETSFNKRLNNCRKDVKKVDAIMACKYFQQETHNFNKHTKFTIIDQVTNTSKSKKTLIQRLIERENFWILKLDTLYRKVLTWNLVNSEHSNYNKTLLSSIRLSNIRFSPLQLGHYHHFEKIYLTSCLICNLHNFK